MTGRLLLLSLSLLLLAWTLPAPALTIHRCTGSDGTPAFQDHPCAPQQQSGVVVLRAEHRVVEPAATVPAPSTPRSERQGNSRARASTKSGSVRTTKSAMHPRNRRSPNAATASAGSSWECRASNGEIFYQHGPCPAAVIGSVEQRTSATRGRRRSDAQSVPVAGRPIARADACRRIHAASASDRAGHERDEDVSTYERNLGRDPCR